MRRVVSNVVCHSDGGKGELDTHLEEWRRKRRGKTDIPMLNRMIFAFFLSFNVSEFRSLVVNHLLTCDSMFLVAFSVQFLSA